MGSYQLVHLAGHLAELNGMSNYRGAPSRYATIVVYFYPSSSQGPYDVIETTARLQAACPLSIVDASRFKSKHGCWICHVA